ncbi:sigma-70 family RNA polymerase sigma factor [Candidatus Poribacteria bacterium]|nr:sigma-70 family RNA polymerase sigma factor [Candidatus Poribacteria bacterium]
MSKSDRSLVAESLRGSRDAFTELVRRYERQAYAIAYARLLDHAEAEDVTQDTFLAAYERLAQLRAPERFPAWVSRIALSRTNSRLARRNRETPADTGVMLAGRAASSVDQEEFERRADIGLLVEAALLTLPDSLRVPLVMRYMGGLSYKEIGEALFLDPEAAGQRIRRALQRLRERFDRHGIDDTALSGLLVCPLADGFADGVTSRVGPIGGEPRPIVAGPTGLAGGLAAAVTFGMLLLFRAAVSTPDPAWGVGDADVERVWVAMRPSMMSRLKARSDTPPTRARTLLTPDGQLEGWRPIQPRFDTATPVADGAGRGVISNDFGAHKRLPPAAGVVTLRVWLRPALGGGRAALGLTFSRDGSAREEILRREADGQWAHRLNYLDAAFAVDDTRGCDVLINYRTATATYDLVVDGRLVLEDAWLAEKYAGSTVHGVFMASGEGGRGAPLRFDGLRVWQSDDGTHVARPDEATADALRAAARLPRILLGSGVLNGRPVSRDDAEIRVAPAEPIQGSLLLHIEHSHGDNAAFPVIETPTWGDHARSYRTVVADAPTGVSMRTATIDRVAPDTPGVYHIVIAGMAETEPRYVASGTNWSGDGPVWNNGTDVAGWSDAMLDQVMARGSLRPPWLTGVRDLRTTEAGATAIRVVVEGMGGTVATR